jgi:membrane associated rhomboid family serine protease
MVAELRYFLKTHFQRSDNGLMQLILLNGLVFVGLLLIKTGLVLAGYEGWYQILFRTLTLPAVWETFLQQPWSLVTYFWVHDAFFDVVWHLLFLYSFGQLLLNSLSSKSLIVLYILGGLGGGICFLLLYNLAPGFQGIHTRLVGSAASLYAVMAGAATLLPHFYFQFLLIGRIKVKYIVGALLLLSCFELSQHQAVGIANLSGALIGYWYVRSFSQFEKLQRFLFRFYKGIRKNKPLQVTYQKSKSTVATKDSKTENQTLAIDQILDKVAESGYESLTKEEKRQLFEAGQ